MMFLAGAGPAIVFFFLMAALAVLGIPILAYAAHCFLTVVEFTAAGQDEIRWPDEPLTDWLWKPLYLLWLLAFWLIPAWLVVAVVLTRGLGLPLGGFYGALLAAAWLLFPLGLFSSLSANHRMVVFRPAILRALVRQPLAVGVVYLASGVLVVGWGALFYYAMVAPSWWWLPVASTTGAVVLLLYARLLGRLAWVMTHGASGQSGKSGKRRKRRAARIRKDLPLPTASPPEAAPVASPLPVAGVASEEDDEWAPPQPYVVQEAQQPVTVRADPAAQSREDDPEPEDASEEELPPRRGYSAAVPEPPSADARPSRPISLSQWAEKQPLDEEPPPPASPLWGGVYTFPFYPSSVKAWICLSLAGLVVLLILRGMLAWWVFGD
ncbi:MAG TPA: hypothetical protein VEL76_17195 [Gemmataceae bacterium]|nr:hypothetical protein [Gemmataceae bacterium]